MQPRIIVSGITGLIGRELSTSLLAAGYDVVGLSRRPMDKAGVLPSGVKILTWQGSSENSWHTGLSGATALINLAGENIAGGRWSQKRKQQILDSRLASIEQIQSALLSVENPPKLLIQASATGFYGHRPGEMLNEESTAGEGFLARVCKALEEKANAIDGMDVINLRTGIVLSNQGGALPKLTASMRFGAGGYPGNGRQMVPWIHIQDVIQAIIHLLQLPAGQRVPACNLTAPEPVMMKDLVKQAARKKGAFVTMPIPASFMKLMLGSEMVQETLLVDQMVAPTVLLRTGFSFRFPVLQKALSHLLA